MTKRLTTFLSRAIGAAAVLIVIASAGLWVYFNLFRQYVLDCDAAKLFYHTICMNREHTLAIADWVYMTTAEWDCASLLAVLFYPLTNNILIAFGLSNILNVLLFGVCVWMILKKSEVRTAVSFLLLGLFLVPWKWGMLNYSNMLFYGGAQYIYKVLVPLLLIALLDSKHKKTLPQIVMTGILLILTLAVSSSSGIYVFFCGILPVLVCRVVYALSHDLKKIRRADVLLLAAVCLVYVAGIAMHKFLNITTPVDSMMLRPAVEIPSGIARALQNLFETWNIITEEKTPIFSLHSIIFLLRLFLFSGIVLLGLSRIGSVFALRESFDEAHEEKSIVCAELISIFIWNFLICSLTRSTERYQLIGWIPLVITAGIALDFILRRRASVCLDISCRALLVLCLGILTGYLWIQANSSIRDDHMNISNWVRDEAQEHDCNTVIYLDDIYSMEEARTIDLTRKYTTYFTNMNVLRVRDDYADRAERGNFDERHLLIVSESADIENLTDHLRRLYACVEDFGGGWKAYLAESNRLDGLTGPGKQTTIDFAHSYGYRNPGTYDENDWLDLSGGELESPEFVSGHDGTRVILRMQILNGEPTLSVMQNGSVSELALQKDTDAVFEVAGETAFSFKLTAEGDSRVKVDRIEFVPLDGE